MIAQLMWENPLLVLSTEVGRISTVSVPQKQEEKNEKNAKSEELMEEVPAVIVNNNW